MPMRLRTSLPAKKDIKRLYRASILKFGLAQADRYYDGLDRHFQHIARFPSSGTLRPDLGNLRLSRYGSHHVVYCIDENEIVVLRVLHGHQDVGDAF